MTRQSKSSLTPEGELTGSWFLMCNSLETGGIERQFNLLAKALHDQGRNVRLGCLNHTGTFLDGLGEVVHFSTGGSFLSWECFRSRLRMARFFREHSVLVAQSFDYYSNLMMVSVARLARVPVVIACQNQLGDLHTSILNRAELANFRFCDRVVCNSGAALERLARLGIPRKKLALIPNGIAPEAFAVAGPLLPPVPQCVRIGMVARMNHAVKNQDGFLRAAAQVSARHANVEFILAGDGPLRPALEQLTRDLGLQNRVRFLGDRRDIASVLASLDIAVTPSHSESLSNSLLEAMAAGKAIVATDAGGTREVVHNGHTGLLVPRNDVQALAAAMDQFVVNPDLRQTCGLNARRLALDYTLDRLRDRHIALYSELLDEKRISGFKERLSCTNSGV